MLCVTCQYKQTCRHKTYYSRKQLLGAIRELSQKLEYTCCISTTQLGNCNMHKLFHYFEYLQKVYERVQREKLKPFVVHELQKRLSKDVIIYIMQMTTEWNTKK